MRGSAKSLCVTDPKGVHPTARAQKTGGVLLEGCGIPRLALGRDAGDGFD